MDEVAALTDGDETEGKGVRDGEWVILATISAPESKGMGFLSRWKGWVFASNAGHLWRQIWEKGFSISFYREVYRE